jgi:hypothetical protein
MDLTTLAAAILVALGLLTTDAVLHSGSVSVEVAAPSDMYKKVIDQESLQAVFTAQLDQIGGTVSVVNPPEIRSTNDEGIGMVLADSANVKPLAFALQRQIGYNPDHLRFALFTQDNALHAVVSGYGHARGAFSQEFAPEKDEKLLNFIERCAIWGGAQLAPYSTALFLVLRHAGDGDFRDAEALAGHALATLPHGPVSEERAKFENLLGLIEVFRHDPRAAQPHFQAAAAAWPDGPVPVLNTAFTEIQLADYAAAAARTRTMLASLTNSQKAIVAAGHLILAAALIGLNDLDGADTEAGQAVEANPESPSAPELWADLKASRGDPAGADRLNRQAQQNAGSFENSGEMAALYFHISWHDGDIVTRSRFAEPGTITFH